VDLSRYVYGIDCNNISWSIRFSEHLNWKELYNAQFHQLIQTSNFLKDRRDDCFKKFNDDLSNFASPWCYFWTLNASVPKSALLEAGLFDERFLFKGSEDLEMGYRLYLNNMKFLFHRGGYVFHLPHPRSKSREAKVDMAHEYLFLTKFPNIEIETLCSFDCGHTSFLLPVIKNAMQHQISSEYDISYDIPKLSSQIRIAGDVLFIGCTNIELVKSSRGKHVVEVNTKRVKVIKKQFPEFHVYNLMGTALPFDNNKFGFVIFNDAWRCYSDSLLSRILDELLRVGEKVFLIKNVKWVSPELSQLNSTIADNDLPYWSDYIFLSHDLDHFTISLFHSDDITTIFEVKANSEQYHKESKFNIIQNIEKFNGIKPTIAAEDVSH